MNATTNISRRAEHATQLLRDARMQVRPLDALPAEIEPRTVEEAYLYQAQLNLLLSGPEFGKPAGYKIGCTTSVMQEYMGIPHPCAGRIFENSISFGKGTYSRDMLCRPGVECEIAVRLGQQMSRAQEFAAEDCAPFVSAAAASIELIDDRWSDFRSVSTPSLIADNFFNAGCVIGEPASLNGDALRDAVGRMRVNGKAAGEGSGADILGHPLAALAWLANHCMALGEPLGEGQWISLGSVVQTVWIDRGDRVEIEFEGLGGCSLELK